MLPASDPSALRAFLEHPARPAGTLSYHELQGFLFTVVSAPEVSASEWLPIIFAGEDVDYSSVEEATAVIGQIMALYNTIKRHPATGNHRGAASADRAPPRWIASAIASRDCSPRAASAWKPSAISREEKKLSAVSVASNSSWSSSGRVSSQSSASHWCPRRNPRDHWAMGASSSKLASNRVLPSAVAQYAQMGRSIATVPADHEWDGPELTHHAKIARNEPCPCGSGKKYKKCCGATVH